MGYTQRFYGVLIALIQLNVGSGLVPGSGMSVQELVEMWEDFKQFKIGENSETDFKEYLNLDRELKAILDYRREPNNPKKDLKAVINQEIMQGEQNWRFLNMGLESVRFEDGIRKFKSFFLHLNFY